MKNSINNRVYLFVITVIIILFYNNCVNAQVPSSTLSKKAIERNKTVLQKELELKNLTLGNAVFIRIYKQSNEFEVWIKKNETYSLFKTYKICYFSGNIGTKTRVGDGQAPEGIYQIYANQMNPFSSYHLSFNIGYPNSFDQANGYTGSSIMVHGNCVSIGCFAMTDPIIEEIWTLMDAAFNNKQKFVSVFIFPFKFKDMDLTQFSNHSNYMFWKQLNPIDAAFNKTLKVPSVKVQNKKYVLTK